MSCCKLEDRFPLSSLALLALLSPEGERRC